MGMANGNDEIAVFIDTNLGTHIALAASPNITLALFKRHVETEHFICFPHLGEIMASAFMLKFNSCFYHLPHSLLLQHLLQCSKRALFLHLEARPLNHVHVQACSCADVSSQSQGLSVSSIINRYFPPSSPSASDVTSRPTPTRLQEDQPNPKSNTLLGYLTPKQLPDPRGRISKDELHRAEVGKRLVTASESIRLAASKQRPAFRSGKSPAPTSSSVVKSLVFEILTPESASEGEDA